MADSKPKILFVDDEQDVRSEFGLFLSRKGYEVLLAADGLEALALIAHRRVDLCVTDYNMPHLNGVSLMVELGIFYPDLPIIVMSGVSDMQAGFQALRDKDFDFVAKPAHPVDLLQKIAAILERKRASAAQGLARGEETYAGVWSHCMIANVADGSLVTLHVQLEDANKERIWRSFRKLLQGGLPGDKIILNLEKVTGIDRTGMAILAQINQELMAQKKSLVVCITGPLSARFAELVDATSGLAYALSIETALQHFQG
ncbi:MAG: response regulator [Leptospiraceae bacterium]|nr:response regulator [Leptospiraceae bacterium]